MNRSANNEETLKESNHLLTTIFVDLMNKYKSSEESTS